MKIISHKVGSTRITPRIDIQSNGLMPHVGQRFEDGVMLTAIHISDADRSYELHLEPFEALEIARKIIATHLDDAIKQLSKAHTK